MIGPPASSSSSREGAAAHPPAVTSEDGLERAPAISVPGANNARNHNGTVPHAGPNPADLASRRVGQPPRVSVIIPARNAEATIVPTLDSIFAQDYEGPIEVIIADGSETPATSELVRRSHPDVKLIPNPERTRAPGANAAIRAATGDIMVRCDAHTTLPPNYVSRAVETLERTGAANVGGRQLAVGTTLFERTVAMAMTTPLGVGDARHRLGGKEGVYETAFLGVFSRETLDEMGGGYDNRAWNEDYEFNYQLRKRGKMVWFDPELVVDYRPRGTLWALARQYFNYGRGKSATAIKHPGSVLPRQLAAPGLALSLVAGAALALAGFPWLLAALLLAYLPTLAIGAAVVGFRRRDAAAILLPLALATMHLSWGVGFFIPPLRSLGHARRSQAGA